MSVGVDSTSGIHDIGSVMVQVSRCSEITISSLVHERAGKLASNVGVYRAARLNFEEIYR